MIRHGYRSFIAMLGLLLAASCANIVAPGGGPKDVDPPQLVAAEPPAGSVNVRQKEFSIRFNEFVVLKDLQKFLLISPPPAIPPDIQAKRRTVEIKLEDSLKANTTYNIYFGNAITDLNEGNPVRDFSYVFSTGTTLDSMQLSGILRDALSLEPVKDALVMLYDHTGDSLPFKETPSYVCRSTSEGRFQFRYLAEKPYQLIALSEKSPNMLYDDRSEAIGFSREMIKPWPFVPDSVIQKDSSLASTQQAGPEIFLSVEKDSIQRLLKSVLINPRELHLIFQHKVSQLNIDFLPGKPVFTYLPEYSPGADTIRLFITSDPVPDSAFLVIQANQMKPDTLEINMKKSEKRSRGGKDGQKGDKLSYTNTHPEPGVNNLIRIIFNQPVEKYSQKNWQLRNDKDSTLQFTARFEDSIHRKLVIVHPWAEETAYSLIIPDSCFYGYTGQTNDSIRIRFTTHALKEYGDLKIRCKGRAGEQYRLELLNAGKLSAYRVFTGEESLHFPFLKPAKYSLRIIFDQNQNGVWDPGSYLKRQLPEKVNNFPRELDIRANWELEEDWTF